MLNMKKLLTAMAVVAPMAFLGACATNFDVDKVAAMPAPANGFAAALQKRYIERAKFEVKEGDWRSVDFFTSRAEMAAMGQVPAVQSPDDRRLKLDVDAIKAAYGELTAALAGPGPKAAPDACALAQTWFEHWMEQSEEGHQKDHAAEARAGYEKAIPDCKGAPAPKAEPAPAPVPGPFLVLFDFNSSAVNAEGMKVVKEAAAAAAAYGPTEIFVRGHTDTTGSVEYNRRLAKSRADAVAKALKDAGVKASVNTSDYGKSMPVVQTGDGVKEMKNRRVEILFRGK